MHVCDVVCVHGLATIIDESLMSLRIAGIVLLLFHQAQRKFPEGTQDILGFCEILDQRSFLLALKTSGIYVKIYSNSMK